jgi:thiamine pyrophosphokinase
VNVLLVAGGSVDLTQLQELCSISDRVIALDRGLDYLLSIDVMPDMFLGDMDSVQSKIPAGLMHQTFPAEKGFSDLEAGLVYAHSLVYDRLHVLGAFGTRMDHLLSGLSLLAESEGEVYFLDPHNRVRRLKEKNCLEKGDYSFFSIQPLCPCVVSIEGAKYDLRFHELRVSGSLGLSNEWKEKTVHIQLHSGNALLIESRD